MNTWFFNFDFQKKFIRKVYFLKTMLMLIVLLIMRLVYFFIALSFSQFQKNKDSCKIYIFYKLMLKFIENFLKFKRKNYEFL